MSDWSDDAWLVFREEPNTAHGEVYDLHLEYEADGEGRVDEREHCNERSPLDGALCRLWKDHGDLAHVPFSEELVAVSGVYVTDIEWHS